MVATGRDQPGILLPAIGMNPAERCVLRPRAEIVERYFLRPRAVEKKYPAYGIISNQSDSPAPGFSGAALAAIRTASARARSRIASGTSGA